MSRVLACLFVLISLMLSQSSVRAAAAEGDFFVAPGGNDAWSGQLDQPNAARTDGPFATIARAQQAVRQLKSAQPQRSKPIVVAVRGGNYFLDKSLVFEPADSGTAAAPAIYRAYGQERPVLSGGRAISGWKVGPDGRWSVVLDDVKAGRWSFAQLFVNDQRRFRPRLPKQGYYTIAKAVEPTPQAAAQGHNRFGFTGDQIRPGWAGSDVEILCFQQWSAARLKIAAVDPKERVVTFASPSANRASWAAFPQGHRFLAINVREALSEPGEFYLDRASGELTYLPRPGEKPDTTAVVAPRLDRVLTLSGDVKARKWVEHVEFRGLTLAHTNWNLPPDGQCFPQAEVGLDAAVAAIGARSVVFQGCAVRHAGAYAMAFGAGSRNNRVEDCELFDLAGGGIKIGHAGSGSWGEASRVPGDEEELVSHHTVRNCLIAHGGRMHPAAIGVWIGHSPYNVVEHNDIFDFYYSGTSIGWVWGYAHSNAHHNTLAFNHIHTIGQGVLSDMGGVYTLGVSPGTVVRGNHIHDVRSHGYGGWGLYTDEGSTGIVMEDNLVHHTKTGGFHQHYGRENRIQNNIFAAATEHQIQRTRTEQHVSFFFERNIVWWKTGPLLGSNWGDNNFKMDYNCYWNAAAQPVTFPGGLTLQQWQQKRGQDLHSLTADPGFADPDRGDFRVKPDSPALKIGFKPFDYGQAGRKTKPTLTADLPPVPKAFD
jgi:hypothetical protein